MAKTTTKRAPVPLPEVDEAPAAADNPWRCEEMPVVVLEAECAFSADNAKATIVVEHEGTDFPRAIEELGSTASRNLAISYASAAGVGDARLNGNIEGPYAVNEEGTPLEEVKGPGGKPYPPQHPKMQPYRYRANVPVCRKLV